jgi:hypothetical protein
MGTSIAEAHPELARQIHPTLNGELDITKLSRGSKRKVWWLGDCKHVWEAAVSNRTVSGNGCPFCRGKLLVGFNDIATTHPELSKQWHPIKNGELSPSDFTKGSHHKAWWLGNCDHEWDADISSRASAGKSCPYCAGQKVLVGFNDLESQFPAIASEWHPSKNGDIIPSMIASKSNKSAWWLGKCSHEWKATIDKRTIMGRGCPVCSGNKVLVGHNDIATTHPELLREWDTNLNGTLTPNSISIGSAKTPWWTCSLGHSWQVTAYNRIRESTGCPVCSGRRTLSGFNDFASAYPELAKEFYTEKNGNISAESLTCGSNIKVWWKCSIQNNHQWQTTVGNRVRGGGCPLCSTLVSKGEQEIADFLSESGFVIVQSDRKVLQGMELDIYIPSEKFAIEYNGLYWHSELRKKSPSYHYGKWAKAKSAGVQLIQIWEDEWLSNKDLVKKMLLHKLGKDKLSKKIYGRNTKVVQLTKKIAEPFLEKNHIQGFQSGSYYYGLQDIQNEICAIIILTKEKDDTLNIVRYATSDTVVGGFTKLLKYAEKTLLPKRFITFSDHCISDGGLYGNNGFSVDKELPPDYKYIVGLSRKHKFGFRLKRFMNDPDLRWEIGLTEKELAQLNGLLRIWDAGKTKWIKEIN